MKEIYKIITGVFLLTYLLCPFVIFSQEVSKENVDKAINKIAKSIDSNYVFIAKGSKIAANLLRENKIGNFNKVKSWKEFDSLVTKSLQLFSNDGHLYIRRNPAIVRELVLNIPENEISSEIDSLNRIINYGFRETKIIDNNIGYIKISRVIINEQSLPILTSAMQFVANTDALIIDLQNNGGGGSEIGTMLESIFLPKNTNLLQFRTRDGKSSVDKTLDWIPVRKYTKPLYILINKKTGSAAEYFAFLMQYLKRGIIVGQASAGAANMTSWYPINNEIYLSVSVASPTVPGTEISWEQKGVQPDFVTKIGDEINFVIAQTVKRK